MKKIGLYPQKKTYSYQERCEESRIAFLKKLSRYRAEDLIYMDESGIDSNETLPYGWSKKGQRFHSSRPGKRRERLSIVGALCQDKLLAPMVYQGYCTAKVIEAWLGHFLLPQLRPGQVIIMDNAPFHNSSKIKELIEEAGCELLFLPSYSPDLNPIEHWWHKIKTAIRKELPRYDFNVHKAADAAFHNL
ncbi:MAG: IS630 family transposase [Symploca sp. SIO3E6]|nr:IS630 family transposase [Caldora sp. SIO3E6]